MNLPALAARGKGRQDAFLSREDRPNLGSRISRQLGAGRAPAKVCSAINFALQSILCYSSGMAESSLSRLEQSLYRTYWDDGLLDLWAGLGVLSTGVFWILGWVTVAPALPLLLIILWPAARRRWVEPRVGAVCLSRQRRLRERMKLAWCLQVGWPMLVLVLVGCWGLSVGRWVPPLIMAPAIPLVILSALALGASLMLSLARFSAYAALLFLVGLAGMALAWEPGPLIVIGGAMISGAGLVRFTRFLRLKPVAGGEGV